MLMAAQSAKDEFYQLISSSFVDEQIATIQQLIADLKKKQLIQNERAYYYDLCALFYLVGKDYGSFIRNMVNRRQSIEHLKFFELEDLEIQKMQSYMLQHMIILRI